MTTRPALRMLARLISWSLQQILHASQQNEELFICPVGGANRNGQPILDLHKMLLRVLTILSYRRLSSQPPRQEDRSLSHYMPQHRKIRLNINRRCLKMPSPRLQRCKIIPHPTLQTYFNRTSGSLKMLTPELSLPNFIERLLALVSTLVFLELRALFTVLRQLE